MKKNFIILFLITLIPIKVYALIEVDITRGNLDPLPLAVSPLSIDDKSKRSFEKILKKENIGSEISTIVENNLRLSLIHISEPTRRTPISYAVFCLKKEQPLLSMWF